MSQRNAKVSATVGVRFSSVRNVANAFFHSDENIGGKDSHGHWTFPESARELAAVLCALNPESSRSDPDPWLDRQIERLRNFAKSTGLSFEEAIGIGIVTFICFFLAFAVSHNMLCAALVGGLVLRGLRKVNFLRN
jgi:hypothetical protein